MQANLILLKTIVDIHSAVCPKVLALIFLKNRRHIPFFPVQNKLHLYIYTGFAWYRGVWNKTHIRHSLSEILFQSLKHYSLGDIQGFCYHSRCETTPNRRLSKAFEIASKGFQIISENNYLVSSPCWSKDFT